MLAEQAAVKGQRAKNPWELFQNPALRWQLVSIVVLSSAMQLCGNDSVSSCAWDLPGSSWAQHPGSRRGTNSVSACGDLQMSDVWFPKHTCAVWEHSEGCCQNSLCCHFAWSYRKNSGMYFQMSSLTAFSFFLFTDVFLCSLCVPRGWNSSGQNSLCCNRHGKLWADHICHLCETPNALWGHAASAGREEAVNYKLGVCIAVHAKEALWAQEPGCLWAPPAREVNAEVFGQTLHCHHCLKSPASVTLLLCVHVDGGRVEVQLGHSNLLWTPFLPDSCHQNCLLSFFLLWSRQHGNYCRANWAWSIER